MDLRLDGSFLVEGDSVYGQNPASAQQSASDKLSLIASQAVRYSLPSSSDSSTFRSHSSTIDPCSTYHTDLSPP